MSEQTIRPIGTRSFQLAGQQLLSEREIEEEKKKTEAKPTLPIFLVDDFERHLAQANLYTSQGKSVEASAELGKAQDWLKDVKDESLRKELKIRLDQARWLTRV